MLDIVKNNLYIGKLKLKRSCVKMKFTSIGGFTCEKSIFGDGRVTEIYQGVIGADQIIGLSGKPNVRDVNPKANVIKSMENTVKFEPEIFVLKNMGVTAVARDVFMSKNGHTLEISEGENDGILNGGHSKYALELCKEKGYDLTKVFIRLYVICSRNLSNAEISDISTSLNTSNPPRESTYLEKKGITDIMKVSLKPEYCQKIEWKQNTMIGQAHMCLDDFIKLLDLLDIHVHGGYMNDGGKSVTKGVKSIVSKLNEGKTSYDYLAPVMNDIIELYETVNTSLTRVANKRGRGSVKDLDIFYGGQKIQKNNLFVSQNSLKSNSDFCEQYTLFTNEPYTYNVNKAYMYVILSAFRANLVEDVNGIHWVIPNVCKLFKSMEREIWECMVKGCSNNIEIKDDIRAVDASAATKPNALVWDAVYNLVKLRVLQECNQVKRVG